MRSIEKTISKYLKNVCFNIRRCNDEKKLFYLYNRELSGLDEIIKLNDLNIEIPAELADFRKNGFDVSLSFAASYYDGFKETFDSVRKINDKIAFIGSKLFNKYGILDKIYPKLELSISESLKIVKSFFDYYDIKIFNHLNKILKNGNLQIKYLSNGNTIDGFTLPLYSERTSFIEVNMRKDILLASNIIHEVFHSYVESYMNDISYEQRKKRLWNNLDEVITYFSSLVFIRYLEDINFDEESIRFLMRDSAVRMIFFTGEYSKYFGMSSYEIILNEFDDFLLSDSVAYGTFMAYHYFNEYLKDDISTKCNILNMSLDTFLNDKLYLLNEYGLSSNSFSNEENIEKILRMHRYRFTEKK